MKWVSGGIRCVFCGRAFLSLVLDVDLFRAHHHRSGLEDDAGEDILGRSVRAVRSPLASDAPLVQVRNLSRCRGPGDVAGWRHVRRRGGLLAGAKLHLHLQLFRLLRRQGLDGRVVTAALGRVDVVAGHGLHCGARAHDVVLLLEGRAEGVAGEGLRVTDRLDLTFRNLLDVLRTFAAHLLWWVLVCRIV